MRRWDVQRTEISHWIRARLSGRSSLCQQLSLPHVQPRTNENWQIRKWAEVVSVCLLTDTGLWQIHRKQQFTHTHTHTLSRK